MIQLFSKTVALFINACGNHMEVENLRFIRVMLIEHHPILALYQ